MALRHPFPETVLPDMRQSVEPVKAPPLMKKPKEIRFRPGADVEQLSKEMVGYTAVQVSATLGAGKSTRLPKELAKARGVPVIHVVPSRLLAVDMYDYLSATVKDCEYHLSLSPEDGFGKSGVTITYSANMMAVLLQRGMTSEIKPFGDCMLLLDECHESDCFTYALGKLGHVITGVVCTLFVSATHDPERMPMREADGEVESEMFDKAHKPSTWDPLDAGKPWSVSSMSGNTLLFVDSERTARDLLGKYEQAGATAYRLSAKMQVSAFRHAMKQLRDPSSGIVVLIADYSFRSGFTFDVSTIVDSCVVNYNMVDNGAFVMRCRWAYELERNQAAGRGGRTAGSHCVTYVPNLPADRAICMLEGVEMDAAAVLFRYLGYAPPAELQYVVMAKGNVPRDLVTAANGSVPLALLSADQLAPLVSAPPSVVSEPDVSPTLSQVLDDYALPTPPSSPTDFFSEVAGPDENVVARGQMDGLGFLLELQKASGAGNTVVPGQYYTCPGIPCNDVVTRLYGSDWKTASAEILGNKHLVHGFDTADRHELVALLLNEYNRALTVKCGLNIMLQAQESLTALVSRYPQQVHKWTELVSETMRDSEARVNMLAAALQQVRTDSMRFVPITGNMQAEALVAEQWASKLKGAIDSLRGTVEPEKYLDFIKGSIDEGPSMTSDTPERLELEKDGRREHAYVRVHSSKVGGKRMVDLTAAAASGASWDKRDFKIMLATYLDNAGLDVFAVRWLKLLHTKVSGEEVLQEIRDDPQYLSREHSRFKMCYTGKASSSSRKLLRDSRSKPVKS